LIKTLSVAKMICLYAGVGAAWGVVQGACTQILVTIQFRIQLQVSEFCCVLSALCSLGGSSISAEVWDLWSLLMCCLCCGYSQGFHAVVTEASSASWSQAAVFISLLHL